MDYATYHQKRFEMLMEEVKRLAPDPQSTILEIGRGPFTNRLRSKYQNVTTLGFPLSRSRIARLDDVSPDVPHVVFDLNDAQHTSRWISLPQFDVVIFAEVVEHLTTAPEHVFAFLAQALHAKSHLICQTPNAVCIHNRLKMLLGRNPFSRIELDDSDPAHFREYTQSELVQIVEDAGYEVVRHIFANYFGYEKRITGLVDALTNPIPSFRRGQTMVLKRKSSAFPALESTHGESTRQAPLSPL